MLKTLGVLVIISLVVGAFGLYRGWFTVDRTDVPGATRVTFGLDKDQVRRDADASRTALDDALRSFKLKIDELKSDSSKLKDSEKAALDRQIKEFEARRDELSRQLDEVEDLSEPEATERKREIRKALDEATAALDKALTARREK